MAQLDNKLKQALEQRLLEWLDWWSAGTGIGYGGSLIQALMDSGGELIRSTAPAAGYPCPRAEEMHQALQALQAMLPSAYRVVLLETRAARGDDQLETQKARARAAKMHRRQYCEYLNTGRWILVGMLYGKASAAAFKAAAFEEPEPRPPRVQTWRAEGAVRRQVPTGGAQ